MRVNTGIPTVSNLAPQQVEAGAKASQPLAKVTIQDATGQSLASALQSSLGVAFGGDNTIRHMAHLISTQPQGEARVLVTGVGDRQASIKVYDYGVTQVELNRPPITSLVLSGGGAKGAAYPGAIAALGEHKLLEGIKSMSGSSAGGITAALLASGMDVVSFKRLSDEMDLISLLDSSNKDMKLLQTFSSELGQTAKNILPEKLGSFTQLVMNVLPRIGSDAQPLEQVLRDESRKAVLTQIDSHPEALAYSAVKGVKQSLTEGGDVTFRDLVTLNRHIPEIKTLNITGTAMFKGRPQLAVFNASTAPDMGIARAAHISGSFPVVFSQVEYQMPLFKGEEARGEYTYFQDGGVMLNVPVPELIDPQFSSSSIPQGENLILKFQGGKMAQKGSAGAAIKDWVVGAPNIARRALQNRGLKDFSEQTVVVPLKTEKGDFSDTFKGTLNFSMRNEIKNHLQQALFNAVNAHIETKNSAREQFVFDTTDAALLALDDESLADFSGQQAELGAPVIAFKADSKAALALLTVGVQAANDANDALRFTPSIELALAKLDELADSEAKIDWMAAQLNRSDNKDWQQLLNATNLLKDTDSTVLHAAYAETHKRDVIVIASTIIREQIYPSLYKHGQTDGNIALLRRAEHNLNRATTKEQVNATLDDIISNYEARHISFTKPLNSTTIEMAKSAKL
ncbi:patatin-like phospholipase family protein [Shewanella sp.]|uniref:patatin-like phospholipase family protein n=1 Tax=Shewanella sp. TaxID=50422 RepID=UPI001EC96977|nr:patatin-like phospholipase family protein [Shewanella sp.]NRB24675.1 patatin-like phospholipase family protein [Shewanella sp.]